MKDFIKSDSKKFPIVYEINTRLWLNELSERNGKPLTLATIPEHELQRWRDLKIDYIWLMGVWSPSERGRQIALAHHGLHAEYSQTLPDWRDSDVGSSPYSIAAYTVSSLLGGNAALKKFRERLSDYNIKLMLDFVPNHVALDHPWLTEHPEYFIEVSKHVARQEPAAYFSPDGEQYFACGRDPYFPAWTDTLQLNYANPALRDAMRSVLEHLARQCDAVRCDMAMLELESVFNRTWASLTGEMTVEFWGSAIDAVKSGRPDFLFIAEAYWDTEWTLQQLGFDYCYDKRLYDRVADADIRGIKSHLAALITFQRQLVRFTENHDEVRAVKRFAYNNRAALMLALTLPGMKLLHEGQLDGCAVKVPVQLLRRPKELADSGLLHFYQRLSHLFLSPAIQRGDFNLLELGGIGSDAVIGYERFYGKHVAHFYTLINLTNAMQEVYFYTKAFDDITSYEHVEVISTEPRYSPQFDLWAGGITLRLRPHEGLVVVVR
jgi:glycosidase